MKKVHILLFVLCTLPFSARCQVVINEVYGGGGNSGATYKNDFIELYNNADTAVNLADWSVQYASASGATWQVTPLTGIISANSYYLIQEAAGTGGTTYLPLANDSGSIAMSATNGKVALVSVTTSLTGACPASLKDEVGYGTANCFEGSGAAPALSNTTSAQRTPLGTDTQNNDADFTKGVPSPTSAAGTDVTAPSVVTLSPANSAASIATSFTASITFNESVVKGGSGNIIIKRASDDSVVQNINVLASAVFINGASVSFTVEGLALNTAYYIEISSGAFTDIAGNSFTGISGNSNWQFTTTLTVPMGIIGTTYNFNTCSSSITDGFTTYSVTGAEVWGCTTFGRDPANPAGTTAYEGAVQINGYSAGTNQLNEDWFLSPSFDLTGTGYPLLSFWSRTAFNGAPLLLKVSVDYPGTGNPAAYTWTDINGRLPGQASNIWTQSQNINLSAFKSAHTYFAFVYHSSTEDGARWTLDDIRVDNSATPPPPSLNTNTNDIQFGYVPAATADVKSFTFTGNDLTGSVTLTANGNFLLSKTNGNFAASISYTQAEANNITETVYVQFLPTQNKSNYTGSITLNTSDVPATVINVTGNSIDAALTLEVVNWNLEWFGSADPTLGPIDKTLQENNVKTITQNIGADLFAFAEVVSESELQSVVTNLNSTFGAGAYNYVICNYGSHSNPFEAGAGPVAAAQKEAFVYKTSVISPIGTPVPLLSSAVNTAADLNNPAYNYFSSGRYPFMMYANVTLGGVTKPVRFVELHAKANTSPTATAYARRKAGADTLNFTLNSLYPSDNIVLLGDFNDDLDQSITAGFTTSSYDTFNADVADFFSPTLALSLAGKKSTVSYNDMIDHVELSNEMQPYYMQNSAAVLTDVSSLVANYGTTTSDHYPVFTRYTFDLSILPVNITCFTVIKQNNTVVLNWATAQEQNSKNFIVERSANANAWTPIGTVNAAGNSANGKAYTFTDKTPAAGVNYYRLRQVDVDGKFRYSLVRTILFNLSFSLKLSPNPVRNLLTIDLAKNSSLPVTINIIDMRGKSVRQALTLAATVQIDLSNFAKGTYIVKGFDGEETTYQKLIVQ